MRSRHMRVGEALGARRRRLEGRDAAVIVAVALLVTAAGCSRSRHEPDRAVPVAIDVTTATVATADLPDVYEAGGVVRARTTAAITSRLLAPVLDVPVAPGDRVRRGQVLVRLEDRDLTAEQRRALAGHDVAEQGGRAAEAERDAARSALALATTQHTRISLLHERRSATDDELDRAAAGLREAKARLAFAEARVAEAAAALSVASAGADAARVGASWAVITAPFDGIVTEKLVEPGNMAAPGMPLLRMEQDGAMRVDVRLDESPAAGVTVGDVLDVLLDRGVDTAGTGATGRRIRGRVAEIARAAEAGAHAFLVKIDLPPDVRAPSGTFARALFRGPSRRALVVPRVALLRRGQLTSVFVVEGDRARLQLVSAADEEQGSAADGVLEVLSGLDAGDRVVIDPPRRLSDNAHVRIVMSRVLHRSAGASAPASD